MTVETSKISRVPQEQIDSVFGNGLRVQALEDQLSDQVNVLGDLSIASPSGESRTYFPEQKKPLPGTDITSLKGRRYIAVKIDGTLSKLVEHFILEVGFSDPKFGTNIVSFNRDADALSIKKPKFRFSSLKDQTDEHIGSMEDQASILEQTLEGLRQLNASTMTEASKGWRQKFTDRLALNKAQRGFESSLSLWAENFFPQTTQGDYHKQHSYDYGVDIKVIVEKDPEESITYHELIFSFPYETLIGESFPLSMNFSWNGEQLSFNDIFHVDSSGKLKSFIATTDTKAEIFAQAERIFDQALIARLKSNLNVIPKDL